MVKSINSKDITYYLWMFPLFLIMRGIDELNEIDLRKEGRELIFLDQKFHITSQGIKREIYLLRTSCHRQSTFNSVITGVSKRVKITCDTEYLDKAMEKYAGYLVSRGYDPYKVYTPSLKGKWKKKESAENIQNNSSDEIDPIIIFRRFVSIP